MRVLVLAACAATELVLLLVQAPRVAHGQGAAWLLCEIAGAFGFTVGVLCWAIKREVEKWKK